VKLYLDSSALVKRYVDEQGSTAVRRRMGAADAWVVSQLTFVEMLRVIPNRSEAAGRARAEWPRFDVIAISPAVCEAAVGLAERHRLRSLDAIQLASAIAVGPALLDLATWDRRLHAAALAEGFEVLPGALD
jgi:predicted nucleic acid-binding protein